MSTIHGEKERFQYLDNLRILSIIFVILLHCITPFIVNAQLYNTKTWWVCLFANSIVRTGVPLFFMISGYLLLNSSKTLHIVGFYKKRFTRVLIPFLAWNSIYFIHFDMIQEKKPIIDFFSELFVGGSKYHFWFVYSLMGIYLILPYLKRIVDSCSTKQLMWFLFIITFTGTTRPFINTIAPFYIYLFDPLMDGYIGYIILGYILGKIDISKKVRILIYIGGIAGFLIGVIGNHLYSSYDQINLYFNGGYQLNHFLFASSIFVFFKHLNPINNPKINDIIANISGVVYAVYLMHVLVLENLQGRFIFSKIAYGILFEFAGTLIICLCVMLVISKIKYINKIFM